MKKIISFIAVSFILASSVAFAHEGKHGEGKEFRHGQKEKRKSFWSQQKAENKEFRHGLKDALPEERAAAITQHKETQFSENKAFRERMHGENMVFLKDKLAQNQKLTDVQKTDLINFLENQYQERISFRDQQHKENMEFFQQIAADASLSQEQKKDAIRDHIEQQKSENKTYRNEQHSERKEFKDSLKAAE